MSRQDQSKITVAYQDPASGRWISLGTWDKRSGGEADSDETKYRPGGMAPQISLGGLQTVSNVVVTRLYDLDRDIPIARTLRPLRGRAAISVVDQPLDRDGNPHGTPDTYNGMLKRVKTPDKDSESTSAATWELEVSTSSSIG